MISAGWEGEGVWGHPGLELGFPAPSLCVALCGAHEKLLRRGLLPSAPALGTFLLDSRALPWCGGLCCWLADGVTPRRLGHPAREGDGRSRNKSQGCRTVGWKVTGEGTGRRQHGSGRSCGDAAGRTESDGAVAPHGPPGADRRWGTSTAGASSSAVAGSHLNTQKEL